MYHIIRRRSITLLVFACLMATPVAASELSAWKTVQDPDSGASFEEIAGFLRSHPRWPSADKLVLRAEQSLRRGDVPEGAMRAWFTEHPPISGLGKWKWMELQGQQNSSLIREIWRTGDFDASEEEQFLSRYGKTLSQADHAARADRLVWEEKYSAAERMSLRLESGERAAIRARIALLTSKKKASLELARVPRALMSSPGVTFARLQWHAKRDDERGMLHILLNTPTTVPYPERWWKWREKQVRAAIDVRDYNTARQLLAKHGQTEGAPLAEATWLSGWLDFLRGNPRDAYMHFYQMYEQVKFPVSRARAAYWAARAAEAAGDTSAAGGWWRNAAQYTTTFYGQLAALRLSPGRLPALPSGSSGTRSADSDVLDAALEALQSGEKDLATQFVAHVIDTASSDSDAGSAAGYVASRNTFLGVRGAKRAMQRGVLVLEAGYPTLRLGDTSGLEPALVHAIVRQESEFDAEARSRANAQGLMQLLPSTARETVRKAGLSHSASDLYDPAANTAIGSAYLARLVEAYDGSYVLAIASYNAGPGNVRNWLRTFGSPSGSADAVVDWIEKIPFAETRNYVFRVLENVQVYRTLLGGPGHATLVEDLAR